MAESRFKRAAEERAERQAAGGGRRYFKPSPEGAVIRFLEDLPEIEASQSRAFHTMPPQGSKKYAWWEICLAQDEDGNRTDDACPGCEENDAEWGSYRKTERGFVNIIWRDAPVEQRKKDGQRESTGDQKDAVVAWSFPQTVGEKLYELHLTYKDLTSRDFIIKRTGKKFDTVYSIQPWTDDEGETKKTPMSEADKELAKEKYSFDVDVAMKKYDDWGVVKEKKRDEGASAPSDGSTSNPFKKKKPEED